MINRKNKERKRGFEDFLKIIIILFGILTIINLIFPLLDEFTFSFIGSEKNSVVEAIMLGISSLGNLRFLSFVFLIFLGISLYRRKPIIKMSAFYLAGVGGVALLTNLLKVIFERERPFNFVENGFSFPSGHASSSIVAYGLLAFSVWPERKKTAYAVLIFPLLIGISRIYLNVHWMSDVLFGFFIGAVWFFAMIKLFQIKR